MKRFSRSALAVACAQIVISQSVAAQTEQTAGPGRMEHVLVTIPLHKETAETALPISVLTGEELRRNVSATLGDTLRDIPGVANASFGPAVGQPVIRGQTGPRVRVLQNGTTSSDASKASQDHANAVESMLATSIEVLRGPSTLLYGGGAIGGVVNVLDNRIPTALPDEASGGLGYRHDTASNMDVLVGKIEGSAGDFAFHADAMVRDFDDLEIPGMAVREHDDDHEDEEHEGEEHDEEHGDEEAQAGIVPNTAGEARSFTLGSSYHFDSGFVGFSVARLENEYGLPAGSHNHEHEEEHGEEHEEEHGEGDEEGGITLDMEQTRYDGLLHWHDIAPGVDVVRAFATYTDYEHVEIEPSGEVGTLYANESFEGRLEVVHVNIGGFDGVLGLQTSAGEFSAIGEEAFIPTTDYAELGLFVVEDYHLDDWTFELGARYDTEERDPQSIAGSQRFNAISASASGMWQMSEDWRFGVAAMRSERAPSIEELYSNIGNAIDDLVIHAATGAYEVGNADLDTEVSRNVDLSLRWDISNGSFVSAQVYYNDFADYINLVNTGVEIDESPVREFVQDDAEFVGAEFDSDFTLGTFGGGILHAGVFGDITRGELSSGDDVPRLPPLRVGLRVGWDTKRLSLWTRVLDAAEQDRSGANEEDTPGYTRWDVGVEYVLTQGDLGADLYLTLNNITDEEIRLATSFLRDVAPEPGFGMQAGVRLTF